MLFDARSGSDMSQSQSQWLEQKKQVKFAQIRGSNKASKQKKA
jgi:hypothetical protein